MNDDVWFDGDEADAIAALQRRLAVLRTPPAPWGDVLARTRFARPRPKRPRWGARATIATSALLAAALVAWCSARPRSEVTEVIAGRPIAAPAPAVGVRVETTQPPAFVPIPVIVAPPPREEAPVTNARERRSPHRAEPKAPRHLTRNEVRDAIDKVKYRAQLCADGRETDPDSPVRVKLTIDGTTGRVRRALADPPHADTPLGSCVAAELAKAVFPRFGETMLSVKYTLRL
jgi:hypothetical protein